MDIALDGDSSQSQTIRLADTPVTVAFDDVAVGATVYVTATAYTQTEDAGKTERKDRYAGQSDSIRVQRGSNAVSLALVPVYAIQFELGDDASWVHEPDYGYYQKGSAPTLPGSADVQKDGYIFVGWRTRDADGSFKEFAFTPQTTGDLVLYAHWAEYAVLGIIVDTGTSQTDDITLDKGQIVKVSKGTTVTFTVTVPGTETVSSYKWFVDDDEQVGSSTGATFAFDTNSRDAGTYDIAVYVTAGNDTYSAFAQVMVQ